MTENEREQLERSQFKKEELRWDKTNKMQTRESFEGLWTSACRNAADMFFDVTRPAFADSHPEIIGTDSLTISKVDGFVLFESRVPFINYFATEIPNIFISSKET